MGFIVSTIRKEFILSCENDITRTTWLNHLRIRKQEIIKESLGHRKPNPAHIEVNKIITKKYENLWNMKFASSGTESKGNFFEGSIEMQNKVMNPGIVNDTKYSLVCGILSFLSFLYIYIN